MKSNTKKKRKIIIPVLIVVAVLVGAGVYAYNMATDVVAETLVTKIAATDATDPTTAAAEDVYNSMSHADQAKVKEIAANHVSAANVKAVTEYLGNNDIEGLKAYAYENLSSSEITELKDLYDKYK